MTDAEKKLRERMRRAAEAALADHGYVSAVDVFTGMGLLTPADLEDWRRGRAAYLERVIHTNLGKISRVMHAFREWAAGCGLKPSETFYRRWGKGPKVELRFSASGAPSIEKAYRTHYVPRGGRQQAAGREQAQAGEWLKTSSAARAEPGGQDAPS